MLKTSTVLSWILNRAFSFRFSSHLSQRDWYQHARDQAQMQRISVSFAPPSDEEGAEAGATASPVDEAASQTASAKTAPSASSAQSTSASNDDLSSLLDDLMPPSRPSASSDSTQWDVPRRS